ncbi:Pantoate-beta-alanine ligase [Phycisphaerae bacterium RAS2]|nr:Pantoate-beta-alanine ligase [Phycisphaerae bacterium RAS2]
MHIAESIASVRPAIAAARAGGRTIGFVPTMGALHAGHVSLIDRCRADGCFTVVSIFVNPTQFGPNEDLNRYPRTLDADRTACERAGVDVIFAPTAEEMYPPGEQTRVRPGRLADTLCGPFRPGHFEGVCTVVAKLFNIVQPDVTYFGQKDAQQALILRRMAIDLAMPVQIVTCPIVRDADGLALSSRNALLSREERSHALALYRALCIGRDAILRGEASIGRIVAAMRNAVVQSAGSAVIDYLSLVDPDTLEPITPHCPRVLIAGAIRLGGVRLIDNLTVEIPPPTP